MKDVQEIARREDEESEGCTTNRREKKKDEESEGWQGNSWCFRRLETKIREEDKKESL